MAKRSKPSSPALAKAKEDRQGIGPLRQSGLDLRAALPPGLTFFSNWSSVHSYAFLAAATILSLLPFSAKAFNVDDTLFVFAARQIVKHPLDPYGFELVWEKSARRMSDITMNPPLACYYAAVVGRIVGWSERALHLAFLLPALAMILGTYRLARRCTRFPLLAALAALLTPGVLVSATSVMCDTMMVALWIWAAILWTEGLEPVKPVYLIASSFLIAASALTKYYGIALIPLLLVYSFVRLRRLGWWAAYLAIPAMSLVGYEIWSAGLYGRGLIEGAAKFSGNQREFQQGSTMAHALVSLSFVGGCTLSALAFMPLFWRWKQILLAALFSVVAALALTFNWVDYGVHVGGHKATQSIMEHWALISFQLTLCILAGVSVLAIAIAEVWRHKKDADSWLLALWVVGTWIFAGFLNWTVNARSVLPLIPAAGILMFRRLDWFPSILTPRGAAAVMACAVAVVGLLSFWVTASDVAWANSARQAADLIYQKTRAERGTVFFAGHWGFQYYMQAKGFIPADQVNSPFREGDLVIMPENNTELIGRPSEFRFVAQEDLEVLRGKLVTTMDSALGAGYYSSYWGPLPFAFGGVRPELYQIGRLAPLQPRNKAADH
ncbi:MAG: glycosyltransferase family 39 protein [Terriglobales bacterium]